LLGFATLNPTYVIRAKEGFASSGDYEPNGYGGQNIHQITVNAPLLIVTVGPTSVIIAPLPFWM
jgi:hypothetical protein